MASMKLKTLEHMLQNVDGFENPKIALEQYTTTPHLSASILHAIQSTYDDIEDKIIADLGCGCGILSIGAQLLGAACTVGFDIDPEALFLFAQNLDNYDDVACEMVVCDVINSMPSKWTGAFDTVIMNPPFGTRNNGVDVKFVETALSLADTVYSLHKTTTRPFFMKKSKELEVNCEAVAELKFDLPRSYKFHTKKSVDVFVDVLRFYR